MAKSTAAVRPLIVAVFRCVWLLRKPVILMLRITFGLSKLLTVGVLQAASGANRIALTNVRRAHKLPD